MIEFFVHMKKIPTITHQEKKNERLEGNGKKLVAQREQGAADHHEPTTQKEI